MLRSNVTVYSAGCFKFINMFFHSLFFCSLCKNRCLNGLRNEEMRKKLTKCTFLKLKKTSILLLIVSVMETSVTDEELFSFELFSMLHTV